MISTRFLPMSWTSPLTVASSSLPLLEVAAFSMNRSRWATAAFITSALCRTSATMSSLAPKSRPTSSMPAINGPLMMSSAGTPPLTCLPARERVDLHPLLRLALPELGGEDADVVIAALEEELVAERLLVVGDGAVADQL